MSQTSRGQAGELASLREQVPGQQETLDFWASLVLLKGGCLFSFLLFHVFLLFTVNDFRIAFIH